MQGRKFFFYLWSIAFILPIFSLHGQVEKINENGEKIIEFSDGSTIHYKNDAKEEEFALSFKERISKMSDKETRSIALDKLKKAKINLKNRKKTRREFTLKKVKLEKKYKKLKKSTKKQSSKTVIIKQELKQIRPLEKDAIKSQKLAEKEVDKMTKLLSSNNQQRKKMLIKMQQQVEKKRQPIKSMDSVVLNEKGKKSKSKDEKLAKNKAVKTSKKSKKDNISNQEKINENIVIKESKIQKIEKNKTKQKKALTSDPQGAKKTFASYKVSEDVLLNPPKTPCVLSYSGKDEFTGQKRKDVAPKLLFAHTDEELKPYMNGKDYLTCDAFLTSLSGGFQYLTLEFTIASKNAQKEYGLIHKGNILTIRTLDGKKVNLQASKAAIATYDSFKEAFVYKVSYRISGSGVKQLKKSEVDKIRVIWSSGYVDYEVYEVDFFIDQFDCLKNGK